MNCPNCGADIRRPLWDSSFCTHDQVFYCHSCCHGIKGYAGRCPLCARWASRSHFFLIFYGLFAAFLFLLLGASRYSPKVFEGAVVLAAIPALVAVGGYALYRARCGEHELHAVEVRAKFALRSPQPLPPLER